MVTVKHIERDRSCAEYVCEPQMEYLSKKINELEKKYGKMISLSVVTFNNPRGIPAQINSFVVAFRKD